MLSPRWKSKRRVGEVLALYVAWTGATYLLEGLPRSLLRPEATGLRLAYAVIANLGIGIVLSLWLIRRNLREGPGKLSDHGFGGACRMLAGIGAGTLAGYALFRIVHPGPVGPIVFLNTFAQVWVVSAAEIMVCWALVGGTLRSVLNARGALIAGIASAAAASLLFGLYHFAHSPPFNDVRMVVFLTGIGFATSLFWLVSQDNVGTAMFHNFFAATGVLSALEAGGKMSNAAQPAVGPIVMALVAGALLIGARSAARALDFRT